jgi:major vault protein
VQVCGPIDLVIVPPGQYCVIANPAHKDSKGAVVTDTYGQAKLRYGEQEVRAASEPFPLFPGEKIEVAPRPLPIVAKNSALRLRALRDITLDGIAHCAGDDWLFQGFPPPLG